jgi:hypothetical protein
MKKEIKEKYLKISLLVIGIIFIFGIWILGQVWPSGWLWHPPGRNHYHEMIMVVYATLGVFLILAAKEPSKHTSLIWFTVWSSIAHATIMAFQSFSPGDHLGHLWGDVAALYIVAGWLAFLMPRNSHA